MVVMRFTSTSFFVHDSFADERTRIHQDPACKYHTTQQNWKVSHCVISINDHVHLSVKKKKKKTVPKVYHHISF